MNVLFGIIPNSCNRNTICLLQISNFAVGVLPICIGKSTRLIEYLNDDKEYLATVQFGASTNTFDLVLNI